jgi:hypothetical protein
MRHTVQYKFQFGICKLWIDLSIGWFWKNDVKLLHMEQKRKYDFAVLKAKETTLFYGGAWPLRAWSQWRKVLSQAHTQRGAAHLFGWRLHAVV